MLPRAGTVTSFPALQSTWARHLPMTPEPYTNTFISIDLS